MVKFDWLNLDSGEKFIWSGEPKINSIYPMIGLGILTLPLLGIGVLIIAGSYLYLKNTDFLITNKGLYRKTVILSTNVKRIKFDKIQNTSYRQTFFGNIFEYGNIEISTAGGSEVEMRFNAVDNPRKVQNIINEKLGDREIDSASDNDEDVLNQILEELKEINEKL